MRVIYTVGILLLVTMVPISDRKFSHAGNRAGNGLLEPGDIRIAAFDTGGGIVTGNVTVDITPIQVWIIPHADYEAKDSFSTEQARYQNFGLFSEFEFDSTFESDLILIMIDTGNETLAYDFIIVYNLPLIWDNGLFLAGAFMGLFLFTILIASTVTCLRNRKNDDEYQDSQSIVDLS